MAMNAAVKREKNSLIINVCETWNNSRNFNNAKMSNQNKPACQYAQIIKPWPNDRNMSTQHIATLLGAICYARLATMLRRITTYCCLKLAIVTTRARVYSSRSAQIPLALRAYRSRSYVAFCARLLKIAGMV